MFNRLRNAYAFQKITEILESTEILILMGIFVLVAGALSWILVRGIYGRSIVRLRYVLFWMLFTQLVSMAIFELIRGFVEVYDGFLSVAVRLSIWIVVGLLVSAMPLVNHALHLSFFGRLMYLALVHFVMRIMLFTLMGFFLAYGLHYPKILSKIARIAPACREALLCVIKDL